jgi:hypothetical protein
MNIFITTKTNHTVFSNGLLQNILSLKDVFKKLGHEVFLVVDSRELNNHVDHSAFDCPIFTEEELYFNNLHIDFLFYAGWDLSHDFLQKLKERKGAFKLINIHYGNHLFSDLCLFNQEGYHPLQPNGQDAVWTSPHFENSIPYLKSFYNTNKVFTCPYIWSPRFIEEESKKLPEGSSAFYSPERDPVGLILEPNVSPYKCSLIPLHIYKVYKQKNNPSPLNKLIVACVEHLTNKTLGYRMLEQHFQSLSSQIEAKGRVQIVTELAYNATHIISHQMHVGLNYVYLDAAYFHTPLIHNSEFIKDFGYYYPAFDCLRGAEKLHEAICFHAQNLDKYKEDCSALIHKYSLRNSANINKYRDLLTIS